MVWTKEKHREYDKKRYQQQRERLLGLMREYRENNYEFYKESVRKGVKKFRENNLDFYRKYSRLYNYNRLHNFPLPHFQIENWCNGKKVRVSRLKGRFVALKFL